MKNYRILFMGTAPFAVPSLKKIVSSNNHLVGVYTSPAKKANRGMKLSISPVAEFAEAKNIEISSPPSISSSEELKKLQEMNLDMIIVVAYGLILPTAVLNAPKLGCINVHGSILPKWRGAAPIQRSIWAGDAETGVTIMQMDEGLDTGDMLHIATLPVTPEDTSATLYEKLAELGPQALVEVVNEFDRYTPTKQDDSQATYAKKLSKEEALINWADDAEQIERNIRAFNPWPVAWMQVEDQNVKVWSANVVPLNKDVTPGTVIGANKEGITIATGRDALCITSLQIPGKKALPASDVINARQTWFEVGRCLTQAD